MANYISSNANRFYAEVESAFGSVASIAASNRMAGVQLQAHQAVQASRRLDKTGTRTHLAPPANPRRSTAFEVKTYLSSWQGFGQPGYGPLFQSAFGAAPTICAQLTVEAMHSATQMQTTTAHLLAVGSGLSSGNEVRFVTLVNDSQTVTFNAPFTVQPMPGSLLAPCITYSLSTNLPSVSLYDYWDPVTAVSRIVTGATVDSLNISINGDFHEFTFAGLAADLIDSSSFQGNEAALLGFPSEPALQPFSYSVVGGHLGQAWIGSAVSRFFTVTSAKISLKNNLQARNQEFGAIYPSSIAAGERVVESTFALYAQDNAQTEALYSAAKLRNPVSMMLQLGQQQGQLMGISVPAIIPEVPLYDDHETRLIWEFNGNVAQGTNNDELFIAFA